MKNIINEIFLCLDSSSSMSSHEKNVIKVVNEQIKYLANRSKELDQETRVSIYSFANKVENLVWNKDVLRLPRIETVYKIGGMTALIDATLKAIEDHEKIPQLYGETSFLGYIISDGQNNIHSHLAENLKEKIARLPDNWTLAVFVPDQSGVYEAKKFGFPAQNISVWDVNSAKGFEEAGEVIKRTTDNFMRARSEGFRGTKSLFQLDANFSTTQVKKKLKELSPSEYALLNVYKDSPIKEYVESFTKQPYRQGSAFYEITKPEKIQAHKQICIMQKINGKVYTGSEARKMLGLPDYEIKVTPGKFEDFSIFSQSTSVNRKLVPGTRLIVLK